MSSSFNASHSKGEMKKIIDQHIYTRTESVQQFVRHSISVDVFNHVLPFVTTHEWHVLQRVCREWKQFTQSLPFPHSYLLLSHLGLSSPSGEFIVPKTLLKTTQVLVFLWSWIDCSSGHWINVSRKVIQRGLALHIVSLFLKCASNFALWFVTGNTVHSKSISQRFRSNRNQTYEMCYSFFLFRDHWRSTKNQRTALQISDFASTTILTQLIFCFERHFWLYWIHSWHFSFSLSLPIILQLFVNIWNFTQRVVVSWYPLYSQFKTMLFTWIHWNTVSTTIFTIFVNKLPQELFLCKRIPNSVFWFNLLNQKKNDKSHVIFRSISFVSWFVFCFLRSLQGFSNRTKHTIDTVGNK